MHHHATDSLETLDDLLAQTEHCANYSTRNIGRMPPTLFLIGPDGPLMFMPESLEGGAAKDDFATNGRAALGTPPRLPRSRR